VVGAEAEEASAAPAVKDTARLWTLTSPTGAVRPVILRCRSMINWSAFVVPSMSPWPVDSGRVKDPSLSVGLAAIPDATSGRGHALASLSHQVLLSVAGLVGSTNSETSATLLYVANSVPLSPRWLAGVPDAVAVEKALIAPTVAKHLDDSWRRRNDYHWMHWAPQRTFHRASPRLKLYLSSSLSDVGRAFTAAIPILADLGAPPFKVARTPRGLLRPDRMVIYPSGQGQLLELTASLAGALSALDSQGVPFTTGLDAGGMLSWGCDPDESAVGYATSWRQWLTRKLGAYLHASDAPSPDQRVAFVLAKIAEDGVDPISFAFSAADWT
jgi:hypothetical protein